MTNFLRSSIKIKGVVSDSEQGVYAGRYFRNFEFLLTRNLLPKQTKVKIVKISKLKEKFTVLKFLVFLVNGAVIRQKVLMFIEDAWNIVVLEPSAIFGIQS